MYLISGIVILVFAALMGMFFGAYIEYTSCFYPKLYAIIEGRDVIALLGAMLTPIIMVVTAYLASQQWQLHNFMPVRDKIMEAEEIFYKRSQALAEEYQKTPKNKQNTNAVLELFAEKKRAIISSYLGQLESLALYLKHGVIPEPITKDFFGAAIINSMEKTVLEEYIIEAQEKDPSYFKTYADLVKKWSKGGDNG